MVAHWTVKPRIGLPKREIRRYFVIFNFDRSLNQRRNRMHGRIKGQRLGMVQHTTVLEVMMMPIRKVLLLMLTMVVLMIDWLAIVHQMWIAMVVMVVGLHILQFGFARPTLVLDS
jgi:hypothetical protein